LEGLVSKLTTEMGDAVKPKRKDRRGKSARDFRPLPFNLEGSKGVNDSYGHPPKRKSESNTTGAIMGRVQIRDNEEASAYGQSRGFISGG